MGVLQVNLDYQDIIEKYKSHDITIDEEKIKKAIDFAVKYHGTQQRESGDLYYHHPLEVAGIIAEMRLDTDSIVTAILHDTIEDTDLTQEMIAEIFNDSVASKVKDLTRIKFDRKITPGETVNALFLQHKKDLLHIKLFKYS